MRALAAILTSALLLALAEPAHAQLLTGRQMLTACRSEIVGPRIDGGQYCLGAVQTIATLEVTSHFLGTCLAPGRTTTRDDIATVVNWMEGHPEQQGDPLVLVIVRAFRSAYSCQRKPG